MEQRKYTRYERTRIISTRALQISQGSPTLVKAAKGTSAIDIAKMEWDKGVIPIDIKKREKRSPSVQAKIDSKAEE
jgi:DNA-directed RNA polymerase subunit K/omega